MRKLLSKEEINKIIKDKPPGVEVNDLLTNLLSKGYSLDGFEVMVVESKGLQGPKGPIGLPGPTGDRGSEGLPGNTGERGMTGPAGPQGLQGTQGVQGVQGIQGTPGTNGSPDTGEEIITKINSTDGHIDAARIKNLPPSQVIYQGGGGFPETQIKAGTNVTVTKDASGSWVIGSSASGSGANVASELLTGSTSGGNITLDLTGLSHTFLAIVGVYRNGSKLVNRTDDGSTSSWTRSGNTITVFNALSSDDYLVDYTY